MADGPRLPVPVSGKRQEPDSDFRAMPEAGRLLYFARLVLDGVESPFYHLSRETPWGRAKAMQYGPLSFKAIGPGPRPEELVIEAEPAVKPDTARLVWLPEGFVITPRTASAPDGYGMPPTPDGKGTPGGPLKEVIINRFLGNQYPDVVYRLVTGDGSPVRVVAAPLFFMDEELAAGEVGVQYTDEEGVRRSLKQFATRWKPLFREGDDGQWHCHRPENHPVETPPEAEIRKETNLIREQVGRAPLAPPLRGTTGELSQDIVAQMRKSGVVEHDSNLYDEGYDYFIYRQEDRSAWYFDTGENLHYHNPGEPDLDGAYAAVMSWRGSPLHYQTMTLDWHSDGDFHAWVDPCIARGGRVFEPPFDAGVVASQIFRGALNWVSAGPGVRGSEPAVTIPPDVALGRAMSRTVDGFHDDPLRKHRPRLLFGGRSIMVWDFEIEIGRMEVLGGRMVQADDGLKLRVVLLYRQGGQSTPAELIVYEGDAHNYLETKRELASLTLPLMSQHKISAPVWSASGQKMALYYTTVEAVPPGRIGPGPVLELEQTAFVGQEVHFLEFYNEAFHDRGSDSIEIDWTDFGDDPPHRNSSCKGSARYMATYKGGEDLDFIRLEVDSYVVHTNTEFKKRVFGQLIFPDNTTLVYADLYAEDDLNGAAPVQGFVRHLLPFDVDDPSSVAYVEYTWPTEPEQWGVSADMVIRGQIVKHADIAYHFMEPGPQYRSPFVVSIGGPSELTYTLDAWRGNPYGDPSIDRYRCSYFNYPRGYYAPAVKTKAVLHGEGHRPAPQQLWARTRAMRIKPIPSVDFHDYVMVGPTILDFARVENMNPLGQNVDEIVPEDMVERPDNFFYATYAGEHIYAGALANSLGGIGEVTLRGVTPRNGEVVQMSAWVGEDADYLYSSLDLKSITGLPDLKDNIRPIGVI